MAKEGEQDLDVPPCHIPECPLQVDVVMKTSDGKYFGTHLQNLESYAEGFPPESLGKRKRVNHIDVEEDSEVISLMLRLMHKQPQPDIRETPIEILIGLAEAVEKYLVYSAMNTCRIVFANRAVEAPFPALAYALKHNYHDVADLAAPHTLNESWKKVRKELGLAGSAIWVEYRESFYGLFREQMRHVIHHQPELEYSEEFEPSYDSDDPLVCEESVILLAVLSKLFDSPRSILDKEWKKGATQDFPRHECSRCGSIWNDRSLEELADKAKALPKFSRLI